MAAQEKLGFMDAPYQAAEGKAPNEINGFKNISGEKSKLKKYGLRPDDLKIDGTDFKATVYEKDGKIIVSFKGTTSWLGSDMSNNAKQAFNVRDRENKAAPYYVRAQEIATSIMNNRKYGDPIPEFVGHSLGGGLASAAAATSGFPATVYNPSGLHPKTVENMKPGAPITVVRVAGEAVTGIVNKLPVLPNTLKKDDLLLDPPLDVARDLIAQAAGGYFGGLPGLALARIGRAGMLHTRDSIRSALTNMLAKTDRKIAKFCK